MNNPAKCLTHYSTGDNKFCKFCNSDNNPEDNQLENKDWRGKFAVLAYEWQKSKNSRDFLLADKTAEYYRNLEDYVQSLLDKQAEKQRERIGELADFTEHASSCILHFGEAGRTTADGGYETKYKGKWYETRPIDKTPKCECGLEDIIEDLTNNRDE